MSGVHGMLLVGNLQTIETSPLAEGKVQFVWIPNLEYDDVVLGVPEVGQPVHDGLEVAEAVGDDDDQSAPLQLGNQLVEDGPEVGSKSCLLLGYAATN